MATSVQINAITALYVGYFDRAPDPAGLQFWIDQIDGGRDFNTIAEDFAASPEAKALYPYLTTPDVSSPAAFVTNIYANLFGRAPDAAGLTFWTGVLADGSVSVADMIEAIINGARDDADAGTSDKTVLDNKTVVALDWATTTGDIPGFEFDADAKAAAVASVAGVTEDAATVTAALEATDAYAVVAVTPPGVAFALTTGVDTGLAFTGAAGDDTFTAADIGAAQTWTVGDAIDGGDGNDTFNVISAAAVTGVPVGASVTNVEIMNVTSGGAITLNTATGFTGLTALNANGQGVATVTGAATTALSVTSAGVVAGAEAIAVNGGSTATVTSTNNILDTITVGATNAAIGAVNVTSTGGTANGNTQGAIAVTGGTEVTVNQNAGNAATTGVDTVGGSVSVTGNGSTTAVTVNQTATNVGFTATPTVAGKVGYTAGAVTIADAQAGTVKANTIATVSLSNAGAATVDSDALSTLNLAGKFLTVDTTNSSLATTPAVTTFGLNVNGAETGVVTVDAEVTTLNVTSSTAASTVNSLVANGATAVNVAGDAKLTLTGQTLGAVTDIVVTNTAGASFGTALGTAVNFTGGAGADAVSLGATTKAITMGAGNDTVTTAGLVGTGGSVNAGDGIDTIVMTSADAALRDGDATFNSKFTGFETLRISDALATATTLNLTGLNAVSTVELAAGSTDLTSIIDNLASGGTVKLLANSTGLAVQVKDAAFNPADVLNLGLSKNGILAASLVEAAGVETVNITSADAVAAGSAAVINTMTLAAADATKITVAGNNGLDLGVLGGAKVTTFDAAGVVGNGTADSAANLAVTYVSGNATASATVAITGGAGNDTLTGNAAKDTIVGGAGDDQITGGLGIDVMTGGAGRDTFVIASGDAGITGAEKITDFALGLTGDTIDLDNVITILGDKTATDVTAVISGAVDVTATVKDGIITIGGADAALVDSLGEFKLIFEAIDAGADDSAAFAFGGNTYVISDAGGAAATDIIQLVGLSGATSLATVAADGAILIA